jgi:hypothetical protein
MNESSPVKHVHRHYMTDTKVMFEPVSPEKYGEEDLYKRVEYAILMCNSPCNDVKKVTVKKEAQIND